MAVGGSEALKSENFPKTISTMMNITAARNFIFPPRRAKRTRQEVAVAA
jgi:hypothetical protein